MQKLRGSGIYDIVAWVSYLFENVDVFEREVILNGLLGLAPELVLICPRFAEDR